MGIGGAAQNAREGGRRRAGGLSGEPEEHRASRRLTRTLLTLSLQQHLPDVVRAKADALGLNKQTNKKRLFDASADLCPRNAYCKDYSAHFERNGFLFG